VYLFAQSGKLVLGREVKEIQYGSAVTANGAMESIPNGPVDGVIDRIQASDGDQWTGWTAQFGWEVELSVIDHVASIVQNVRWNNKKTVREIEVKTV